jgi:hypothetical protein
MINMATKSGTFWVTWAKEHAQNSSKIEDLVEPFRSCATAFITALESAGATVDVSATKRSARRAYLFHWSWKIALGKCPASQATSLPGVDILWDHGNELASKRGAQEMVTGFGLAVPPKSVNPPATTSNHITGQAIDMDIMWTGTIKVRDRHGNLVAIPFMTDVNANTSLHAVGASYGVRKLATDAPHWSHDGH